MTSRTLRQSITIAAGELAAELELRETAARDAERMMMHALGISRATIAAYPERVLTAEERARFDDAVARRLRLEPVQYITGEQEFYGLMMEVTRATLIPRPETEHLVEAVLERVPPGRGVRIVDVGTGSGAIAIALAAKFPLAKVRAVDLSREALAVARRNAARHGVGVTFVEGNLLAGQGVGWDVVVSNPPYVPVGDRAGMHAQVREWEPETALFAGETGLDVYRRLVPEAREALVPGGLLAMEIGYGQAEEMRKLLVEWGDVGFVKDLQGIERVVLAKRL